MAWTQTRSHGRSVKLEPDHDSFAIFIQAIFRCLSLIKSREKFVAFTGNLIRIAQGKIFAICDSYSDYLKTQTKFLIFKLSVRPSVFP